MKKLFLVATASAGIAGAALVPTAVAAGTCELEYSSAFAGCNGDQICEMFANWDYQDCLDSEWRGETAGGPGNP